jgi:predicted ATPase
MCIITKSDLNRLYDNLDRRQRDKDAVRQEIQRKKEMSERSAELTKSWSNTIIVNKTFFNKDLNFSFKGARERKLELKKHREEADEERKKQLDIEEEKLAAERRREQIEKAKQLQYYETDRVRTFHVKTDS